MLTIVTESSSGLTRDEAEELGVGSIHRHLGWPRELAGSVLRRLEAEGRIRIEDGVVKPAADA